MTHLEIKHNEKTNKNKKFRERNNNERQWKTIKIGKAHERGCSSPLPARVETHFEQEEKNLLTCIHDGLAFFAKI